MARSAHAAWDDNGAWTSRPAASVGHHASELLVVSTGFEPRYLVPYLVLLIGSNFDASTPCRISWAAMQLSMIYLILSRSTHRRLQPWCFWCRGGGGGEDVDETPPVIPHDDHQLG